MLSNHNETFQPKRSMSDRDFDVFDPVLTINDLSQLKDQIIEESRASQDNFNLFESGLVQFWLPQVPNFPNFVEWCAQRYFKTLNGIMSKEGMKVLCRNICQLICETVGVSDIESKCQELIEGSLPQLYKQTSLETKVEKLRKLI